MKTRRQFSILLSLATAITVSMGTLLAFPGSRGILAEALGAFQFRSEALNPGPMSTVPPRIFSEQDAFHWLEPIQPNTGDLANLDRTLLNHLTVQVCMVTGTGCQTMKIFNSAGVGSEQLRIITTGQGSHYIANWDSQKAGISRTETYRLSVSIPGIELGTIDLTPNIYNTWGRTWPIKFLVENNPVIRVRIMRHLGKSASLIASTLRNEFGLTEEEIAALLAGDRNPFTALEIEVAINGVFQEDVIISPNTKVSDENTSLVLQSYSPDTGSMVFGAETPFLKNVKAGDVLVGDPSAASPNGYLRRVTSKRKDKGQIFLETTQATLADAVYQGSLDARNDLREADVDFTEALADDGTLQRVEKKEEEKQKAEFQKSDIGGGYEFFETFDETFDFNSSGGSYSGTGKVRVQGSVYFNAGYNFGWGAEFCADCGFPPVRVDRVEGSLGVTQRSEVRITGDLKGSLFKEKVIKRKYYKPIAFMIGPIPVWILPIVDVVVGARGDAQVRFDFQASVNSSARVGAKWTDPGDGGEGWKRIEAFSIIDADANLNDFELNMKLTAWGKGKGRLLLYGVLGPTLDVAVGGGFEFRIPGKPVWKLYGHIAGEVTFEVSILGVIDLARFSDSFLLGEPEIKRSENFLPRCTSTEFPITVNISSTVKLGPQTPGGSGYFDCMDPEGEQITYTFKSDREPNDVFGANNTVTFGQPFDAVHTITVTARDASGGVAPPFTLSFNVINPPPVVGINTAVDTVPVGVQFFVNTLVYDPDQGGYLPCTRSSPTGNQARVIFSVTAPDTVRDTGDGFNCTAEVIFNQTGPRSINVLAYDKFGTPGSQVVNVNVTAAPSNQAPVIDVSSINFRATATRSFLLDSGSTLYPCTIDQLCSIPNGAEVSGGASSFPSRYRLPFNLGLVATDPDGPAPNVIWWCRDSFGAVSQASQNPDGTFACSAFGPARNVFIGATVSDGLTTVYSEVRMYRMTPLINPN